MEKTLAQMLAASRGQPVEYQGQVVHAMWSLDVDQPLRMTVQFDGCLTGLPQGLCCATKDGTIEINGQRLKKAVLWTETAPPSVDILLQPSRTRMRLDVWNTWRDEQGIQHSWIGNSGMLIDRTDSGVILHCSKGGGQVNFESLVVHIQLHH